VRVPALPRADKQHAVSRVLDDIAAVVKMKREFLMARRSLRENHLQIIIAARAALLEINAFILKKGTGSPCSPVTLSTARARESWKARTRSVPVSARKRTTAVASRELPEEIVVSME